jgi:hypothetical protein
MQRCEPYDRPRSGDVFLRLTRAFKKYSLAEIIALSPSRIRAYLPQMVATLIVMPICAARLRRIYAKNIGRFIHLRDLQPITNKQWMVARKTADEIGALRDHREEIIKSRGLDPEIALPGGQWDRDGAAVVFPLFDIVRKGDYQTINNLRLFSYMFSGFYLAHLASAQGVRGLAPPEINDDLSLNLDRRAKDPPPFTVLEYCEMTRRIPPSLRVRLPKMLGEIGWDVDGSPVNTDTRNSQTRLNIFYETGITNWLQERLARNGRLTVMEIGAGIGDICFSLSRVLAPCRFIICDLPESLLFSATYLRLVAPQAEHIVMDTGSGGIFDSAPEGVEFIYVPNYCFGELSNVKVDFAYNFGSFEEMSAQQVRQYGLGIASMIGSDGIALDVNEIYGCNSKIILADCFPFRHSPLIKTVIAKNSVDLWGNQVVQNMIPQGSLPLKDYGFDWYWRLRQRAIMAGLLQSIMYANY